MKFVFGCWINAAYQGKAVMDSGGSNQLLSYWDVHHKEMLHRIPDYVRDGWLLDCAVKAKKLQK